jgi:DNA-directed RNA polymerase specialized sigma24 family protein
MTDFERMRVLIRQEERYHWAVEKQMAKATKSTTSITPAGGCGGTRTGSRPEDGAVMLATLQEEYKEILDELEEARKELRDSIARIRNAKSRLEKTCLRMRYLQGMSVRQIAVSLNYTEDYLHRKMRDAEALILRIQRERESKNNKTGQVG